MSKAFNKVLLPKSGKNNILENSTEKSATLIADNFSDKSLLDIFKELPPDLEGWINVYLKLQVDGLNSIQTQKAVRNDLKKFHDFFIEYHHSLDIRQWLPRTTQRFINYLEEKGQKPQTIKRCLFSIRTFARWVLNIRPEIFQMGEPTIGSKPPIQQAMKPKGLTEKQVKRLLDAAYHLICQANPDERLAKVEVTKEAWYKKAHRQMRRPFRDYAILMLLLNGGLRRSEICDIRLDQLQDRHLKNIKCKGNLYRDVLIGEETLRVLHVYLEEERSKDKNIFSESTAFFLPSSSRKHRNTTGQLSVRSINVIVEQIAETANQNLPPEEQIKVHPHMFRHTHAYQILKKGKSLTYLQKRLGHQSMNYLALYTQMPEQEEKELLDGAEFK
jgi:site-specific recombinase XerD